MCCWTHPCQGKERPTYDPVFRVSCLFQNSSARNLKCSFQVRLGTMPWSYATDSRFSRRIWQAGERYRPISSLADSRIPWMAFCNSMCCFSSVFIDSNIDRTSMWLKIFSRLENVKKFFWVKTKSGPSFPITRFKDHFLAKFPWILTGNLKRLLEKARREKSAPSKKARVFWSLNHSPREISFILLSYPILYVLVGPNHFQNKSSENPLIELMNTMALIKEIATQVDS